MNSIITDRLILRPYQLSDAPTLRERANSFAVARNLGRLPHPYPEGEAERWISTHDDLRARTSGYPFAIVKDCELLGTVGIERHETSDFELGSWELGYWLSEPYWGQGLGTEAVRALLAFAFDDLALPFVRARHIADNTASGRVLEKVGFLATERRRTFHPVRQTDVEMIHLVLPRNAFVRDDPGLEQVYSAA